MVPNQKDVLADYLCDMLGVPSKDTANDVPLEALLADGSPTESPIKQHPLPDGEDVECMVDLARTDVQDAMETAVKRKALSSAVAVLEDDLEVEWNQALSSELDKLCYQIERDKQLTCLMDLVHRPSHTLSLGEQSLVLLDLLELLKQLPESKLKNLLREQYDKIELAKRTAETSCVSAC